MKHLFIYIFLLSSIGIFSQQDTLIINYDSSQIEQKKFDLDQIEKYRVDKDFNYEEKKQKTGFFTKILNWFKRILERFFEWLLGVERASGAVEAFLSVLPYMILAVILYFLLRFFLRIDANSLKMAQNKKVMITLNEEDQLIKNEDIKRLINDAIEAKNYRLAIRYYYVALLQDLTAKELIEWQQEKTNEDYIKELKEETIKKEFIRTTLLYDFVWYGNFNINEPQFLRAQTAFEKLNSLI